MGGVMLACVHCAWVAWGAAVPGFFQEFGVARCGRPVVSRVVADEQPFFETVKLDDVSRCDMQRRSERPDDCGPDGRFWEAWKEKRSYPRYFLAMLRGGSIGGAEACGVAAQRAVAESYGKKGGV